MSDHRIRTIRCLTPGGYRARVVLRDGVLLGHLFTVSDGEWVACNLEGICIWAKGRPFRMAEAIAALVAHHYPEVPHAD